MSTFDLDSFMNTPVTGSLDTNIMPVPAGQYRAVIDKATPRQAKDRVLVDILWNILDEEVIRSMGRDKVIVRQSLFLDLTEAGSLDLSKGKNVDLGKLRAAVGQNDPERAWSFGDLIGAGPVLVNVTQRPDKDDPEKIYNDVRGVSPL